MMVENAALLDILNTGVSLLLFLLGLLCLLTQRKVIKQVIGLRIMVQGVMLGLIQAGLVQAQLEEAQTLVVSGLIVEAIVIAIALVLIVNVFLHYPSGDIDDLSKLRG